ncbi:Pepco domain-containing protein [Nostoc sp.]|uniref:Pepco domain-containing protein n=1 Tax=Nostoc sp. TaxID=1180 RepID=UPI002FF8ACDA
MSETPQNDGIWIVTDEVPQISIPDGAKGGSTNTRGWGEETIRDNTGSKGVGDAVKVSAQTLEQNMSHFLKLVGSLFNQAEQQAKVNSRMQLDEIELSVEISADGEVKLIGSGVKAGSKGAIKLKFKRQESQ